MERRSGERLLNGNDADEENEINVETITLIASLSMIRIRQLNNQINGVAVARPDG